MYTTVVLLNISVGTMICLLFKDSLMNRKFTRSIFNIINAFTVHFDQFNVTLLNYKCRLLLLKKKKHSY